MSSSHDDAVPGDEPEAVAPGTGRSNFLAYIIGGAAIGVGLLAFLVHDEGNLGGRDVTATGSIAPRIEVPAEPAGPPMPPALAPAR